MKGLSTNVIIAFLLSYGIPSNANGANASNSRSKTQDIASELKSLRESLVQENRDARHQASKAANKRLTALWIGPLVAAVGVIVAFMFGRSGASQTRQQLIAINKQLLMSPFLEYTRRYDEIYNSLHQRVRLRDPTFAEDEIDQANRFKESNAVHSFFFLYWTEFHCRELTGRIDDTPVPEDHTWNLWTESLYSYFAVPYVWECWDRYRLNFRFSFCSMVIRGVLSAYAKCMDDDKRPHDSFVLKRIPVMLRRELRKFVNPSIWQSVSETQPADSMISAMLKDQSWEGQFRNKLRLTREITTSLNGIKMKVSAARIHIGDDIKKARPLIVQAAQDAVKLVERIEKMAVHREKGRVRLGLE